MSIWDTVKDWQREGLSIQKQIQLAKQEVQAIKSWCDYIKQGGTLEGWRKTLS